MRNLPAMTARLPKEFVAVFLEMGKQNWRLLVLFFYI